MAGNLEIFRKFLRRFIDPYAHQVSRFWFYFFDVIAVAEMIVIGVIGSPAGGKSTVAKHLRELGATWINADRIAHRCLDRPQVRNPLLARFGSGILENDGKIDRKRLGAIVFGDDAKDPSALDYLESIVHPMARHLTLSRLTRAALCGVRAAVLDAPLLLEADWGGMCDEVWCVDAPFELRESWIESRGWNTDELRRREKRQWPISEKRRLATKIIENNSDREALIRHVDQLWKERITTYNRSGGIRSGKSEEFANDAAKILSRGDETTHCLNYLSKFPTPL